MNWKRKLIWVTGIAVVIGLCFGAVLHVVTEPWRVYSNDYRPFLWTIPAFLGIAGIGMIGLRFFLCWFLILLIVPYFVFARGHIVNARLQDSISSCGNHSGFWNFLQLRDDKPLPLTKEFADFLAALQDEQDRGASLHAFTCPGYKRVGTKTGVVFVGGGLNLASLRDMEVLVAFCSWKSHPIPYDHQHCLVWEWGVVNGNPRGIFRRNCTDTTDMINRIERALQQAKEGVVPYSNEALVLLTNEIARRTESVTPGASPPATPH